MTIGRLALPLALLAALLVPAVADEEPPAALPRNLPGLTITPQPGWERQRPRSSTRAAQYRLPRAEGDPQDAELCVFAPMRDAPDEAEELARWFSQWSQPDGRPSAEVARREERAVAGMRVVVVELTGTYEYEVPNSGQRSYAEGYRMLGALVETPRGRYFCRLLGPAATVARWEESWKAFLAALRPRS